MNFEKRLLHQAMRESRKYGTNCNKKRGPVSASPGYAANFKKAGLVK